MNAKGVELFSGGLSKRLPEELSLMRRSGRSIPTWLADSTPRSRSEIHSGLYPKMEVIMMEMELRKSSELMTERDWVTRSRSPLLRATGVWEAGERWDIHPTEGRFQKGLTSQTDPARDRQARARSLRTARTSRCGLCMFGRRTTPSKPSRSVPGWKPRPGSRTIAIHRASRAIRSPGMAMVLGRVWERGDQPPSGGIGSVRSSKKWGAK